MEKLIEAVRNEPSLYDVRVEGYREQQKKDLIWEDIARKLGRESKVVKQNWKKLRDCYRQALNRRNCDAGKLLKPWRYEKQMEFLAPFINSRSSSTNPLPSYRIDDGDDEDPEKTLASLKEEITISLHSLSDGDSIRKRKIAIASDDEDDNGVANSDDLNDEMEGSATAFSGGDFYKKSRLVSTPHSSSATVHHQEIQRLDSLDDMDLFFLSVCQSSKRLPRRLQNQIKRDVLDCVARAEERHELETSRHVYRSAAHNHFQCCHNNQRDSRPELDSIQRSGIIQNELEDS